MHAAIVLRLSDDNGSLTIDQTLSAIHDELEAGGQCWIPFLNKTSPAAGNHEHFPVLLIVARKQIRFALHILEMRRGALTGRDLADTDAGIPPEFDGIAANAWLKVCTDDALVVGESVLDQTGFGQGINYVRLESDGTWRRTDANEHHGDGRAGPIAPSSVARGESGAEIAQSGVTLPQRVVFDRPLRVLGIDLTASGAKASAACVLTATASGVVATPPPKPLLSDDDIVAFAQSEAWDCVALDGPRAQPRDFRGFVGRDEQPSPPFSRAAEREVHRRIGSIFFYSPRARPGVREWLLRSTGLFGRLTSVGDRLIEVYPHATFVALVNGTDRRSAAPLRPKDTPGGTADRETVLAALLGAFSSTGLAQGNALLHDLIDAAGAAATALCHAAGCSEALGDPEDGGVIVVPKLNGTAA